jgi:membrane protein required for colicin V production
MMNFLDVIFVCIIGFYLIRGLFRGFIKEIFSIIGVFVGFFVAVSYYGFLSQYLIRWISHPSYLPLISFFTIFLFVYLFISILGVIIKYLLRITILGWVDRLFGLLFGAAKGALFASIILVVLTAFFPSGTMFISNSRFSPYLLPAAEKIAIVTPKSIKHQVSEHIKLLRKIWRIPN